MIVKIPNRNPIRRVLCTLSMWLIAAAAGPGAWAISPEEQARNDDRIDEIEALIGVHNFSLPLSFSPDPWVGLPASGVTLGTNIGLKSIRAPFVHPDGWSSVPNTEDAAGDTCTYDFNLKQSEFTYSNLLGIWDTKPVPSTWGDLGFVDVAHANSDVRVSVNHPSIKRSVESQTVSLPEGTHTLNWKAETQISDFFDIILPASILTLNSARYGAAWSQQGASAARAAAIQDSTAEVLFWIAVSAGATTANQLGNFKTRTAATEERKQAITIYDVNAPTISTATTNFSFEALDFGGLMADRILPGSQNNAVEELKNALTAADKCGRSYTLSNDAPRLLPIGTSPVTWTVRDLGPNLSGGTNSASLIQYVTIEDTQEPIMVPPAGRVIEVGVDAFGQQITTVDAAEIDLGRPLVVDLADPSPTLANNGPLQYVIDTRNPITWTATDASGNAAIGTQLITVKAEGTNTPPTVTSLITAETLTSDPIDIRLTGVDRDIIDGIPDPLSFMIEDRPDNGEFVAPLFPYFIEDYRTNPAGPFGEEFRLSNNRGNWVYDNYCRTNTEIPIDWVYKPRFVQVTDDGTHYILDSYWWCNPSNSELSERISKWDRDGNFLGWRSYGGTNDAFVLDRDENIYTFTKNGAGSSTTLFISRCPTDFTDRFPDCDNWKIDYSSTPGTSIVVEQLSYARVDSQQQILYVNDRRRVFAFDIDPDRTGENEEVFLAAMKNGDRVIGSDLSRSCNYGSSWTGFAMEVDSKGALYVADSCQDRIHKFDPSSFDGNGNFVPGDYVGWMGRCDSSTNKACDEESGVSKGYSCTNETCTLSANTPTSGREPGQFSTPVFMALDPNDTLYVADSANARIQRFAEDGSFAGEAVSTGTGINQGDRPSFVLGNMGNPKNVTVNSTQFYVVDRQEDFVHVFETTPFKEITDDAVTVTYVSNFDFHSETDAFTYRTSDGLAESNLGVVEVAVARNYRPPIALPESVATDEDVALDVDLQGDDPDGLMGIDFNGLDTLSYALDLPPSHGVVEISPDGLASYTPDADYSGEDAFSFRVSDGLFESAPAKVHIQVNPVADPPKVRKLTTPDRVGAGFPMLLNAEYVDDGAEEPIVAVAWGDGSFDGEGDFVTDDKGTSTEDDDEARLVGVKLLPPPLDNGDGRAVAQHTYASPGARSLVYCMEDHGQQSCDTKTIIVEHLVNLALSVEAAEAEFDDTVGTRVNVEVENMIPTGVAGLDAANVVLSQEANPQLKLGSFSGLPAGCAPASGTLDCALGTMTNGEEVNISFLLSAAEPLIYDEDLQLRLNLHTDSPSVSEEYAHVLRVQMRADPTDSDGDGMSDRYESRYGATNPTADTDGDGLDDLAEFNSRSNPTATDTDLDGIDDGAEVSTFGSDPTNPDTDADGMPDGWEADNQLDPVVADSQGDADGDGLSNAQEFEAGTSAIDPDSDQDGIPDGDDVDPLFGDTDLDGIANTVDPDDDNDGMPDAFEAANGLDRLNADDALADLDGDGISNAAEHQAGSDVNDAGSMPGEETPTLAASVLPLNRSAVVGETVTAFATIINASSTDAASCSFVPLRPLAARFAYQATNPQTNAVTGAANAPADVPAGGLQTFVFAFTPLEEMNENVEFRFDCQGSGAALIMDGVNTFQLSASATPTPDVIALAGTLTGDGIVALAGPNGASAMSVSTVNVGAFGTITARAHTGAASLPLAISLCASDPATAACLSGPAETSVLGMSGNEPATFSVFITATGDVPFDPANHRIFITFEDSAGVVRGSTSVAVRTDS